MREKDLKSVKRVVKPCSYILCYPHGWNYCRFIKVICCPSLTKSSWENNNFIVVDKVKRV